MFDVISIGSATLDVFIRSKGLEIGATDGSRGICVRLGAKENIDELSFESGGGGTNTAVTFARQGLKVAAIIKLAADFAGDKVIKDLKSEKVDLRFVIKDVGDVTDYGTVLYIPDVGRTILVYRGKTKVEVEEIPWEKLLTKWFYVSSVEGNIKILEKLKIQSEKLKFKVAWNPGGGELKQKEKTLSFLPMVTLLNLNKEEMEELLGGKGEKWEVKSLLKEASKLPCEYVVVTDDKNGAYLHQAGKDFWWHCGIFEDVPKKEGTGAGDAFGSGLVSGLIKNFSLEDCLRLASANASSVVSMIGAKKGILRQDEVQNWFTKEILIERVKS